MTGLKLIPFAAVYIDQVKRFVDSVFFEEYLSTKELIDIVKLSKNNEFNSSILAIEDDGIIGLQFSSVPGVWHMNMSNITTDLWEVAPEKVSYFGHTLIEPSKANTNLARLMSLRSMDVLKLCGARAIIGHGWGGQDSVHTNFLKSLGFEYLKEHTGVGRYKQCLYCKKSCNCKISEMIKYI